MKNVQVRFALTVSLSKVNNDSIRSRSSRASRQVSVESDLSDSNAMHLQQHFGRYKFAMAQGSPAEFLRNSMYHSGMSLPYHRSAPVMSLTSSRLPSGNRAIDIHEDLSLYPSGIR